MTTVAADLVLVVAVMVLEAVVVLVVPADLAVVLVALAVVGLHRRCGLVVFRFRSLAPLAQAWRLRASRTVRRMDLAVAEVEARITGSTALRRSEVFLRRSSTHLERLSVRSDVLVVRLLASLPR